MSSPESLCLPPLHATPAAQGPLPAHHVVGNHCLSVPRVTLLARLRIPGSYYSVQLAPGWRLVVLDTTELSGHSGFDPDSEAGREAAAFLAAHPLGPENPQVAWRGWVWAGAGVLRAGVWVRVRGWATIQAGVGVGCGWHWPLTVWGGA